MRSREFDFLRWIVVAAMADWLITRGLARMAIFMPKKPLILAVYQSLIAAGQFASLLCAILGLFGLGLLAWQLRYRARGVLSAALFGVIALSLYSSVRTSGGWLILASHMILSGIIAWLGIQIWKRSERLDQKLPLMVPVLAVWTGLLYHSLQTSFAVLHLPGPPTHATSLFNLGELFAVLGPVCLWWVYGRLQSDRRRAAIYLVALLPGALFLAAHRLNPSMTGILAVWSTGLTLYLPPILYAISLWLGTATFLLAVRQGEQTGLALLLLAAGGFAPLLSTQIFLALIGLSVLAGCRQGERGPAPVSIKLEKLKSSPRILNG